MGVIFGLDVAYLSKKSCRGDLVKLRLSINADNNYKYAVAV